MKIKVCEMFKTIQGEGKLQGVPSVMLRLIGCNLNCEWCDTEEVLKKNETVVYNEITLLSKLKSYHCSHIIITGGEPFICPELVKFTELLKSNGYHITVETNGTKYSDIKCDLVSMSPKLSNSIPFKSGNYHIIEQHNKKRINIQVIKKFIKNYDYQLKFVCRDLDSDFEEVKDILEKIGTYQLENVMIMPLADCKEEFERIQRNMVRKCVKYGFRYANRLQLQIWDNSEEA